MERGWKSGVDHQISPNCPRCGSSNTKFCYYNNYSLTQPRYFCKDCRRYWTKGGSLRNVPIGGGCRKNRRGKSAALRLSNGDHRGVHSKCLAYENPSVHNSCGNSMAESSSIGSALPDGSHIDLARVYANFLNQPQQPEPKINVEIPGLSSAFDNSFSSIQNKILDSTIQIPESNIGLVENRTLSEGTPLDQQNGVRAIGGLPPLPGEEVAGCEEMFWSNSQTVESSHSLIPTTQDAMLGGEAQEDLLFGNWGSFDLSTGDTFSRS